MGLIVACHVIWLHDTLWEHATDWYLFAFESPGEWLAAEISRILSIDPLYLLIAVPLGVAHFFFARQWFDRVFGLRSEPFYRFGLGELLLAVGALAVLFAGATQLGFVNTAALIIALTIPIALMGIGTWVAERERRIVRDLAARRAEPGEGDVGTPN